MAEAPQTAATRNVEHEQALCQAITAGVQVIIRYDNGKNDRTFEPFAVYYTAKERTRVSVSGVQVRDSAKPNGPSTPQAFDVAKITRITVTGKKFRPDPRFTPTDRLYANGILCYFKIK
ncbi:hypothetical protein ABAC460_01010 [Asticcacaulis sp. AC460]|uniref:hypothetical protein n=1 Tax=Asticcacaulis sp. AC460 TaxID=1282360 RepID=UPI0003C3C08D|nr:hypothetical protein [Asticcacaulis sp. AC460]ESQ93313.1 hypothetical protein ABAC460_01010 [Asticcacaulis sp. AC460]